jgi:hypothetical protein
MKRNKALVKGMLILVVVHALTAAPVLADEGQASASSELRCSSPRSSEEEQRCQEMEQQILASTVRVEWALWGRNKAGGMCAQGSSGHATVQGGRYLVTHNHVRSAPLSVQREGELINVSLHSAEGELLWQGPLVASQVIVEDAETLVLDLGDHGGRGLLEELGLVSAEVLDLGSVALEPGMELAQVDWDGERAHVDWVVVEAVVMESGTPRLELDNVVMPGASGGGVYWNGQHVANNWYIASRSEVNSGAVVREYSVAALNSVQAAAPQNVLSPDGGQPVSQPADGDVGSSQGVQ